MTSNISDDPEVLIKCNVELCLKCEQKDELIKRKNDELASYRETIDRLELDAKSTNHYLNKALQEIESFREAI